MVPGECKNKPGAQSPETGKKYNMVHMKEMRMEY